MKWLYRHPVTRMITGYALLVPTLIPIYLGADAFFNLFNLFPGLSEGVAAFTLGWGTTGLLCGGIFLGFYAFQLKKERDCQKATKEFDSTQTGRKISKMIKEICQKNGLKIPYRQLTHSKEYTAAAQSWPNIRRILISNKHLFKRLKYQEITDSEAKFILGHELGHIYHNHSLHAISKLPYFYANILFYLSMGLSAFLILGIGASGILAAPVSTEIFVLLGYLQITNFAFLATQKISQFPEMIVSRAVESQAELMGCQFTSPKAGYRYNLELSHSPQPKSAHYDSYIEQFSSYGKKLLHQYQRWLKTHPTPTENAEDIAIFYPQVRSKKCR